MTSTKNRNKIKQWFITYPQWHDSKNNLRDCLISNFDIDYYKVCQETHEDGNPHFHAVIRLRKPLSKSQILKKFKELYPNKYKRIDVKPVRSIKHSLQYLSKEDTTPLESAGGYVSKRNPKNSILTSFVRQLGYTSITDFENRYIKIEKPLREKLDSDMLLSNYNYELARAKDHLSWSDICMFPEVNRFNKIHREISNIYISHSIDDMTFFIKFYKLMVEPVLRDRGLLGHYQSPPERLQDDKF